MSSEDLCVWSSWDVLSCCAKVMGMRLLRREGKAGARPCFILVQLEAVSHLLECVVVAVRLLSRFLHPEDGNCNVR